MAKITYETGDVFGYMGNCRTENDFYGIVLEDKRTAFFVKGCGGRTGYSFGISSIPKRIDLQELTSLPREIKMVFLGIMVAQRLTSIEKANKLLE